jgi:fucose permease
VLIAAVAMFCILPTLLFFNIYAQGATGLRLTPVETGLMLVPMSAGLFVLARLAPALVRRHAPAKANAAALGAVVVAALLIGAAAPGGSKGLLLAGLLLLGAGLAVPYATAPRLALGALPAGAEGQSSGLINACTFLGGSLGVSAGALVYPLGGLPAVMGLVAAAALLGIIAALRLPGENAPDR